MAIFAGRPILPLAPAIAVLSIGLPPRGEGLALFQAGRRPWAAELDRGELAALVRMAEALRAPRPGVQVPGQDHGVAGDEGHLARALAALVTRGEVGVGLAALAQEAAQGGGRLSLLLDLRDEALRALPWELWELLAPAEAALAPCRVARLVEAPGPRLAEVGHAGLDLFVIGLDPEDPVVRRVVDETLRVASLLPGLRARSLGPDEALPPPAGPLRGLRVLHLVSHGRAALQRVLVDLGGNRRLDPAAAARWLDPVGADLDLALLDVCGGGSQEGTPGSGPAERLVLEGLPAAISPAIPIDAAVSPRFSEALYAALAQGRPLGEAVDAGRRALARLGLPHPSCRWWTPILVLRDADALALRCDADLQGPAAWAPRAGPEVLELLRRATELAQVHGFLGLEHLALMLARWEPQPPRLVLLREALAQLGQRLTAWQPADSRPAQPSPRLRALLQDLPEGAGLAELLDAMTQVEWVAGALPLPARGTAAPDTILPMGEAGTGLAIAACVLEVLGGPEDGGLLDWDQGRPVLGRWTPAAEASDRVDLYRGGGPVDPSVSRRHLRLREDGRIAVLAETRVERSGGSQALQEGALLAPLDILVLGGATRLLVSTLRPLR